MSAVGWKELFSFHLETVICRREVIAMKSTILPAEKYLLTLNEAALYFNVGVKRLVYLLDSPEGAELMLTVGVKRLVKRKKMENFLDKAVAI